MKRSPLKRKSRSPNAIVKDNIQEYVRLIVSIRDKGCVLRSVRGCGAICEVVNDKVVSATVIQADHLITRANSATFADYRLIVCVCRACHGWKHWHEKEYDSLVKTVLSKEVLDLWEKCELDRQAHKTYKVDFVMELLHLKQEYARLIQQSKTD